MSRNREKNSTGDYFRIILQHQQYSYLRSKNSVINSSMRHYRKWITDFTKLV